jgi:hypothetical protein
MYTKSVEKRGGKGDKKTENHYVTKTDFFLMSWVQMRKGNK